MRNSIRIVNWPETRPAARLNGSLLTWLSHEA
jgi:hypothetical protein